MKQIAFFLIILISLGTTCNKDKDCLDDDHKYIFVKNDSNNTINWIFDDNPKDSIWTHNGAFPSVSDGLLYPNLSYRRAVGLEGCWEYYYNSGNHEYYFFFDHDTVQTIGWEAISGTNRGLLKRVKVDIEYLNQNNFEIVYP